MTILRLPRPPLLVHPPSSHGSPTLHRLSFRPISYASFSSPSSSSGGASEQPLLSSSRTPARDRVIDFGKHRGKMLGTLPSSYLIWVSKNLRARDYEKWARLADDVLRDPVYRDRLEWEAAERVLTGLGLRASSSSPAESPVADLLDISERFGWDNEDKDGWSRVDFQLLGTSKGRRIPRLSNGGGGGGGGGRGALGGQEGFQLKAHGHGGVSKVGFLGMDSGVLGRRKLVGSSGNAVGLERNGELGGPRKGLGSQSHGDTKPRFAATRSKNSSIRVSDSAETPEFAAKDCWVHKAKTSGTLNGSKVGYLSKGFRFTVGAEERGSTEHVVKDKKEERRERQRLKREQQVRTLRREVGVDGSGGDRAVARGQIRKADSAYSNPFPGRGALLEKIRRREA